MSKLRMTQLRPHFALTVCLFIATALLLGCTKDRSKVASPDEQLLKRLEGDWSSIDASCSKPLPESKVTYASANPSTVRIEGMKGFLTVRRPGCETVTSLDVTVEKGSLYWKNARLVKSNCSQKPSPMIGELVFDVEVTDSHLKLMPTNRRSVPCGVLQKT